MLNLVTAPEDRLSKQSLMEEIFTSNTSPFYEFAAKMNLSVIAREELYTFIENNFKKHSIAIKKSTIDSILDASDCQPHFVQYFSSVVYDLLNAGNAEEDEDFTSLWMRKIILPQIDVFQDIYDQLTNSQRVTVQAIARIDDEGIFSGTVRTQYDLPVSSSLHEVLKALQKKGLIYKTGDVYKLTNPVFKEWLLSLK